MRAYKEDIKLRDNHSPSIRQASNITRTKLTKSHHKMETTSNYAHKKFTVSKRRRDSDQENILQHTTDQPITKRRQVQGLFRPWLDNDQNQSQGAASPVPAAKSNGSAPVVSQYHANMVRHNQPKRQRSPKEQQRRDRNTLACLLSRRAKQAQEEQMGQQYEQYRRHHAAMLEQQVRLSLYYRQILQQAVFQRAIAPAPGHVLPQQQQQFLQQMALSQQMLIFGGQH